MPFYGTTHNYYWTGFSCAQCSRCSLTFTQIIISWRARRREVDDVRITTEILFMRRIFNTSLVVVVVVVDSLTRTISLNHSQFQRFAIIIIIIDRSFHALYSLNHIHNVDRCWAVLSFQTTHTLARAHSIDFEHGNASETHRERVNCMYLLWGFAFVFAICQKSALAPNARELNMHIFIYEMKI